MSASAASPRTELGSILRVVTAAELLKLDLPERKLIVAPWLHEQALVLIYAKRGVGKTYFSLSMAYAIASGNAFLEWNISKPRRVLYIDGEMPAYTMKLRIAQIVKGMEKEPPDDSYFQLITPDLQAGPIPDLSIAVGQQAIEPSLEGVDVVIVDNLSSLCRVGDENTAESWGPIQQWALSLRRRGITVIFIHHAGKNGEQRGTSRREDVLDVVLKLDHSKDYAPEHGARFNLSFEKARHLAGEAAETIDVKLEIQDRRAVWRLAGLDRLAEVVRLSKEGSSIRSIGLVLGLSKGKIERMVKKAREKGMLQ